MTEAAWTKEEETALRALRRALLKVKDCNQICLYVVDDWVTACKLGIPSDDLSQVIGHGLNPGCVLTDMHDDEDFGRGRIR